MKVKLINMGLGMLEAFLILVVGLWWGGIALTCYMIVAIYTITNLTPELAILMNTTQAMFIFGGGTIAILLIYMWAVNKAVKELMQWIKQKVNYDE